MDKTVLVRSKKLCYYGMEIAECVGGRARQRSEVEYLNAWTNNEDMLVLVEDTSMVVGKTKRTLGSVVYVDEALWRTPIKCRQLKKKKRTATCVCLCLFGNSAGSPSLSRCFGSLVMRTQRGHLGRLHLHKIAGYLPASTVPFSNLRHGKLTG